MAKRRVFLASTLAALAVGLLAAVGACGGSAATSSANDAGAVGADATSDVAADAGAPLLPYPPGPYGNAIGDVLPDFFVMGYAMSPAAHDSTKLPFRRIPMSEVRSKPGCACIIVALVTAGGVATASNVEDQLLGKELANDPTLCALEVIAANLDVASSGDRLPASTAAGHTPTRADLDGWTQAGREHFPVGIDTESSAAALSTPGTFVFPQNVIVRAADMKVVGAIDASRFSTFGCGGPCTGTQPADFAAKARALCATTAPAVETLTAGLEPRNLALAGALYVTDASRGLLKVPPDVLGVAPTVVDARPGDALAVDAAFVYYGASSGGAFTLVAAPLGGGPATDLATAPDAFLALAADGVNVYFARADGVVGSVPRGGGSVTVLATDAALAPTIDVDASYVYFVSAATHEAGAVPKNGGPRSVVGGFSAPFIPGNMQGPFYPTVVRVAPHSPYPVVVAGEFTSSHTPFLSGWKGPAVADGGAQGDPGTFLGGTLQGLGLDTTGNLLVTITTRVPTPAGLVISLGPTAVQLPGSGGLPVVASGQPFARAVTGDEHYAYFTTDPTAPSAKDGAVRRIRWH